MIIHTVQKFEAYRELMETGFLRGNESRLCDPSFLKPYVWMRKQMEKRLGPPPTPECFPIWCWPNQTRDAALGFHTMAEDDVLLTLSVPDRFVLLSDLQLWHFPLNNWYLDHDLTGEEYGVTHSTEEIEESWERVFSVVRKSDVQGTMWEIRKSSLLNAQGKNNDQIKIR